ncbi:hypothetical protein M0R36_04680 [bacterium]|jgi:hypothetical protein|nr:hypothetical protein [bacterium]
MLALKTMEHIYPDIEWYTAISQTKGVTPRCPFANVHRCPRYYWSYSLLGEQGITTKLKPDVDNTVRLKWMKSDLWTTLGEEKTRITSSDDEPHSFNNFCPEVSSQVFGLFASSLSKYVDEVDRETMEKWLVENGRAYSKDWRWDWASVTHRHYTECSTYSLLKTDLSPIEISPTREELISAKPGFFGFSVDLRKLITRFARWWLRKNI